jgi:preprotein translocase subunit SecA
MFTTIVKKVFGSRNERVLKGLNKTVQAINALEVKMKALKDEAFKEKTLELKKRYQDGTPIDQLIPEAFALVREASVRTLGLRHFDVQLIGGLVLHGGNIAEMRTGEGKTLVATLPAYLHALTGKGVHVVTVNDYLAERDSNWMRPIFEFLGISVGVNLSGMEQEEKQAQYACDILYGTNNEFGFDYLRDNMAFSDEEKVQRDLYFAVVDEVDSILIDEARTPLIISGAAEDSSELYRRVNKLIPQLSVQATEEDSGDYSLDEKQKQAFLTEQGHQSMEKLMAKEGLLKEGESLYHAANISLVHHVNAALRAHALYHKDVDYIVANNQVVIVDEHTGRTMEGRRWSEGLHQAIEAKEGVDIQQENQTLASITFQNYFRLYDNLSGMTGTADTEAYELQQIYNLEVVVIPTNKPMIRQDQADRIYLNQKGKYLAVIEDIKASRKREQPVLVGTASIEASELLSQLLTREKIPHKVLNAKFHQKEASIIADAGRPGAVTIATNMAGRGTDIVLGGSLAAELKEVDESDQQKIEALTAEWKARNETVIKAGGLRIIGSERHESRRIDNQLRGRSGRQGDPGSSCFYLSLEDNLMRIFASERVSGLMQKLGMTEDEAIEHNWASKAVENAQRKVEGHNFDIRKQLLQYDNVANDQRKVIYKQRAEIMASEDLFPMIEAMREAVFAKMVANFVPPESMEEEWQLSSLSESLKNEFSIELDVNTLSESDAALSYEIILNKVISLSQESHQHKQDKVGKEVFAQFEKTVILQSLDSHWRDHLAEMDRLRQGIHLRGYAQKDPKQEYKREAFELFTMMLDNLRFDVIAMISTVDVQGQEDVMAAEELRRHDLAQDINYQHAALNELRDEQAEGEGNVVTFRRTEKKVGRNEACPCGSGKKYKHCHGQL